jgi:hypothetical protein
MLNIKSQIKEVLNKQLILNSVDEFVSYNLTNDLVSKKLNLCYDELSKIFNSISNTPPTTAEVNKKKSLILNIYL